MQADYSDVEIAGLVGRYRQNAQAALALAREEAYRYSHSYLGTEHLLLGLLRVDDGFAAKLLSTFGINIDRARAAVEHFCSRGDRTVAGDDLSIVPRLRRTLELAIEESRAFNQPVGTEHLLFGLLRVEEGIGARILDAFDVNFDLVRRAYNKLLAGTPDAPNVPRNQVVTCRVSDRDLEAIDALVEAGIRSGRSDAAAWLITTAIDQHPELFEKVHTAVTDLRRIRGETQAAVQALTPTD